MSLPDRNGEGSADVVPAICELPFLGFTYDRLRVRFMPRVSRVTLKLD